LLLVARGTGRLFSKPIHRARAVVQHLITFFFRDCSCAG
jgi:hypothetical protein